MASNRKMSQALLQRNGVEQVDTAENGLQAVLAALSDLQKYDVIFMDNFMPVMTLLLLPAARSRVLLCCGRTGQTGGG